jgi:hypothetical protein
MVVVLLLALQLREYEQTVKGKGMGEVKTTTHQSVGGGGPPGWTDLFIILNFQGLIIEPGYD